MPFKTRRQKLSSSERRFSFSEAGAVVYKGSQEKVDSDFESKYSVNRVAAASPNGIDDLVYVNRDLLKIGLCALVIIGGQVALRLTLP